MFRGHVWYRSGHFADSTFLYLETLLFIKRGTGGEVKIEEDEFDGLKKGDVVKVKIHRHYKQN